MDLSDNDLELIKLAKELVHPTPVPGGIVSEAGCALRTLDNRIYKGVGMHLVCGLGSCAEYAAIATAITNDGSIDIDTIVAVDSNKILSPCGRCRELIYNVCSKGLQTNIIMSNTEKVLLSELLPRPWNIPD